MVDLNKEHSDIARVIANHKRLVSTLLATVKIYAKIPKQILRDVRISNENVKRLVLNQLEATPLQTQSYALNRMVNEDYVVSQQS